MMQQQKTCDRHSRDCQHQSSERDLKTWDALDGFVVLPESSRQAARKDDTDELNQSDADANAAKHQRFVV